MYDAKTPRAVGKALRETCGKRRPGWESGPAIGRHRQPCVRSEQHSGDHRDGLGQTWAQCHTQPIPAEEPISEARATFLAECAEFEATLLRKAEWRAIDAKLTALLRRQHDGDTSELTRQRVQRLEALQAALCGSPEALAGVAPSVRPLRA
ncbi:hypothetical protein ACFU53_20680 [Streptomyces sp. NPDC057474]|uniref:hypothetical protein n=1 Tax=Streptomyces sp. NPDC057474 TaxID=3346144 RepID=UPI0036AE60C8